MNKVVQKAYEINKNSDWGHKIDYLPELEVGEVVELNDVWDGCGDDPTDSGSYSYKIADTDWINYVFDIVDRKENPLNTIVKITDIELL